MLNVPTLGSTPNAFAISSEVMAWVVPLMAKAASAIIVVFMLIVFVSFRSCLLV